MCYIPALMSLPTLRIKDRVYLDHNATTPIAEKVALEVPKWLSAWGNPSSIHQAGREPKLMVREARAKIARMIGSDPLEIVFTSGGSEANNHALKGLACKAGARSERRRILLSAVEHPSLRKTAEYLRDYAGYELEFIPVSRQGEINVAEFERRLDERVFMVSVMIANNETGNIFPIREMVRLTQARGALFHSDCVQALGKIPVNVKELGVDLASFSGHKFYALKGSGFLYVRRGLTLESLIHGGGQERHRRGGTENVLSIAALGLMCELGNEVGPRGVEVEKLRDHFETRVLSEIPGVQVTGRESPRIPNTSSLVITGVDGETLLMNLDLKGFTVSTGAACSSGNPEPSPVLLGMGLSRAEAQASLRIGLGWGTTREEIDAFAGTLAEVVAHLRSFDRLKRESNVQL